MKRETADFILASTGLAVEVTTSFSVGLVIGHAACFTKLSKFGNLATVVGGGLIGGYVGTKVGEYYVDMISNILDEFVDEPEYYDFNEEEEA